jgi:drug/metabolite transporter (DMT)-like permease
VTTTPQIGPKEWLVIAGLSLVWGGSFLLIELGLTGFGPLALVFLRMSLAIPLMLLAMRWMGLHLPRDRRSWFHLSLLGFLNVAFPMALFFLAQTRIDSSLASILNATTPMWGVVFAHYFIRDEPATFPKIIGVLTGFAGIVLMIGPTTLQGIGDDVLAQMACLLATACFAASAVYARRLGASIAPVSIATGQIITASIMLAPLPLLFEAPFASGMPPSTAVFAVLTMAIASTSIAYLLFFWLIDRVGVGHSMLIALLMPAVAIVLGVTILGEELRDAQIGGMILILAGIIIIDGRIITRLASRASVP